MTWNHRILRSVITLGGDLYESYALHEVYYENDEPVSWTLSAISVVGDSLEDCRQDYEMMARAFELPVLDIGADNKLRPFVDGKVQA